MMRNWLMEEIEQALEELEDAIIGCTLDEIYYKSDPDYIIAKERLMFLISNNGKGYIE